MRFIKNLIKFCIALIISIVLILIILFFIHKERLYEEIRIQTSAELSRTTNMHINIGELKYLPPYSLSMNHITISGNTANSNEVKAIDSIILTPDLNSIFRNKTLKLTLDIENFYYKNLLLTGILKVLSHRVDNYKNIVDLDNIKSVSILTSDILFEDVLLEGIFGLLEIKNLNITSGKLQIPYKNERYSVEFNKNYDPDSLDFSINADNLGFTGTIPLNINENLNIQNLEGMFYTFYFNTDLTIGNYLSPERTFALSGKIKTDFNSFSFLPGKLGRFFQKNNISGILSSNINAKSTNLSLKSLEIESDLLISNISTNKLFIDSIDTSFMLKDGKLSTSRLNALLYKGMTNCILELDMFSENYPFSLSAEIRDIDYRTLLTDITEKKSNIDGKLFANLDLAGYLERPNTYKGKGNMAVITADLGKMPILTPLIGDIYTSFQGIFPGIKTTTIREASADFSISNSKIYSENITFLGDDITINGYGNMDFNGNLDLDFEHTLLEPETPDEEWQTTIRNAIVNLGKAFKKTHLGGTLDEPKWSL